MYEIKILFFRESRIWKNAAHHARLWNRDFTKTPKLPQRGDADLISSLYTLLNHNDRRLRKLYNSYVILAYLMNKTCGENHWKNRLIELIDQHQIDTLKMGFPPDWKSRAIWQ